MNRQVSSFVRRSARMRPPHRRALQDHGARYLLDVRRGPLSTSVAPGQTLDPAAVFGRTAPLVVEVGPGTGESLVPMAAARPDHDVLAFEVYEPAVARLVGALAAQSVENVKIVRADVVDGLRQLVPAGAVSELWTFFPDPWPKTRHHKRRLVDAPFADLVAERLAPGGCWWLATDWADYVAWTRAVLDAHPAFRRADEPPRGDRPVTRFERRGVAAGRRITDLAYLRR